MAPRRKPETPKDRDSRLKRNVVNMLWKNRDLTTGNLSFRWFRLKNRLKPEEMHYLEEFLHEHRTQLRVLEKWMIKCKIEVYDKEDLKISSERLPAHMFKPEIWSQERENFFVEIFGEKARQLVDEYNAKGEYSFPTFEFEYLMTPGSLKMQVITDIWFYNFIKDKIGSVENLKPVHNELEGLVGIWSGTGKRVYA